MLGFLQSNADFVNDHEVARKYLTPAARQRWRPQAGTAVYDQVAAPLAVRPSADGTDVRRRRRGGRPDRRATAASCAAPPDRTVTRDFGLQRVDGEWRIDRLDDGLLLPLAEVGETYRQLSLYFLGPSGHTLVPDTVLLPGVPGLTTKLVARLLRGPTASLRGAVTTAFPPGTGAGGQLGPVRDGLATVQLRQLGAAGRRRRPRADVGPARLDAQAAARGAARADHRRRRQPAPARCVRGRQPRPAGRPTTRTTCRPARRRTSCRTAGSGATWTGSFEPAPGAGRHRADRPAVARRCPWTPPGWRR